MEKIGIRWILDYIRSNGSGIMISRLKSLLKKSHPTAAIHSTAFGDLGFQYYISGRFSFFCGFSPITGNILHHAIEMFLKMALSRNLGEADLKNKFRHNLKRLWKEFKQHFPDVTLDKYDVLISEVNKWEDARYPSSGYSLMSMALTDPGIPPASKKGPHPKRYVLKMSEIDELVQVIFQISKIKPGTFRRVFIGPELGFKAKEYYEYENVYKLDFSLS